MNSDQSPGTSLTKEEMNVIGRAIKGRWGVPDDVKTRVVTDVAKTAQSDDAELQLKAAALLVRIDDADIKREKIDLDKDRFEFEKTIKAKVTVIETHGDTLTDAERLTRLAQILSLPPDSGAAEGSPQPGGGDQPMDGSHARAQPQAD